MRGKGEALHSGKTYTDDEYNLIAQWFFHGLPIYLLCRFLGRTKQEIELAWKRICWNATDYKNKRVYVLKPFSNKPYLRLNGYVKEFINIQMFKTSQKSSASEIAEKTGIPVSRIQEHINVMNTHLKSSKNKTLKIKDCSLFKEE